MNVIIIAALALLVLVVLAVIFITRTDDWAGQTDPGTLCESTLGGECRAPADNKCPSDVPRKIGTCGSDDGGNDIFCCKA